MKTIVLVIVDFSGVTYINGDSSSIPLARGLGVPVRTQPRRSNGKEKARTIFSSPTSLPAAIGLSDFFPAWLPGFDGYWWKLVDSGGWGGIRTHETLAGLPVFKTGAFNRSATHP